MAGDKILRYSALGEPARNCSFIHEIVFKNTGPREKKKENLFDDKAS